MDRILTDIKRLKVQGARNVAKAGLDFVERSMRSYDGRSKDETQKQLLEAINRVIGIRPTEPMLFNALSRVAVGFDKATVRTPSAAKRLIASLCARQRREIDAAARRVAVNGAAEIHNGDVIMTHCHSSTLMEAFAEAKRKKRAFSVIATETQPLLQGVKTSKELLKMGIPVIYCEDSAMAYAMTNATKAMSGCDAILPDGSVVNKIGTYLMALAAQEFGKPFIVLGETLKMTDSVEIEQRRPSEIVNPRRVRGASIINPAFDITPARLVTAIFTERGRIVPGYKRPIGT